MSLALVTGASGFIGPRLVARLQRDGHPVACLVRASSDTSRLTPLGVELRRGDVTDRGSLDAALDGVDAIYHLAGRLHATSYDDFLKVNEEGVVNLLDASSRRTTPPVVVLVSSLAAAGPAGPARPRVESDPPAPVSNYGRSKLAGERAAAAFAHQVPVTILRPPVVFGPGDRDGLVMFRALQRVGLHIVPQKQGLPLSLVDVDSLVDSLVLAAARGERLEFGVDRPGRGVYYVAHPTVSSYAEMGELAAAALGRKVKVLKLRKWSMVAPALVGEAIGRVTGRPSVLNLDKLREATQVGWVCSAEKARVQLGLAAPPPLADLYATTAAWYREAGWL